MLSHGLEQGKLLFDPFKPLNQSDEKINTSLGTQVTEFQAQ
jgi:hypothetical protein